MIAISYDCPTPLTCRMCQVPPASENTASPLLPFYPNNVLGTVSLCLNYCKLASLHSIPISYPSTNSSLPCHHKSAFQLQPLLPRLYSFLTELTSLAHNPIRRCPSCVMACLQHDGGVWALPRLVVSEEVRAHLGSTWKRKKNLFAALCLLFFYLWATKQSISYLEICSD